MLYKIFINVCFVHIYICQGVTNKQVWLVEFIFQKLLDSLGWLRKDKIWVTFVASFRKATLHICSQIFNPLNIYLKFLNLIKI